jgi:adenylosuccinate lyase
MELVKAGADRQVVHEIIRSHSMAAWTDVAAGRPNPLPDLLSMDPRLTSYLSTQQLRSLLDASGYTGDAAERARHMAERIRQRVMREGRGEKK